MPIRDEYIAAIRRLVDRLGRTGRDYRVPEHANIQQCLGYASKYVSGHTTQHYRYDRYRNKLLYSLASNEDIGRAGTVVHVDLGCGPGLFSWVVYDHFSGTEVDVQLYGYDYAPEMVRLAGMIQDELESQVRLQCYHDARQLLADIPAAPPPADVIVTLGHVLVQLADNQQAIGVFATILEHLTRKGVCLVLAVDALGYRERFQRSFDRLCETLEETDCVWENRQDLRSSAFGVLRGA